MEKEPLFPLSGSRRLDKVPPKRLQATYLTSKVSSLSAQEPQVLEGGALRVLSPP